MGVESGSEDVDEADVRIREIEERSQVLQLITEESFPFPRSYNMPIPLPFPYHYFSNAQALRGHGKVLIQNKLYSENPIRRSFSKRGDETDPLND